MKRILFFVLALISSLSWAQNDDIQVTINNSIERFIYGSVVDYEITITNVSDQTINNIVIDNPIPDHITEMAWQAVDYPNQTGAIAITLPSLMANASFTITSQVNVPTDFPLHTLLENSVTVSYNSANNPNHTITVTHTDNPPTADLTLTKTNAVDYFRRGDTIVYTITLTNDGPDDALNVTIYDPLPENITTMSWTSSLGESGEGELNKTLPVVANGETITYTVTLVVPADYPLTSDLTNTVILTTDTYDPTPVGQVEHTDLRAYANLVLDIDNSIEIYQRDTQVQYIITLTNEGDFDSYNVHLTSPLPQNILVMNWESSTGLSGTNAINQIIPVLAAGETITFTVTIFVESTYPQFDNLVYTASVSSDTYNQNPDTTAEHIDYPNAANLKVTKTNDIEYYVRDSFVDYEIVIYNEGPADAINVVVSDPMPSGIFQLSWSNNLGQNGMGPINRTYPVLAPGESIIFNVRIHVPENYNTNLNLVNRVYVTSDTPDPEPIDPANPSQPYVQHIDLPAPKYVTVNTNQYTVDQLVRDVLINMDCSLVSNITHAGYNPTNGGIGYFHANNADFPLKRGIILRSGNANLTQGPFTAGFETSSNASLAPTDANLQTISNAAGQPETIQDVAYIQFEFTPFDNILTFDYLFASNEYGQYQCGYFDIFGFILTDLVTNQQTNLAVVPGTNTIVSVGTIRNSLYNPPGGNCQSANVNFFGSYNVGNTAAPISMRGNTTKLTATSPVIPCRPYRIKLAVGDYSDTQFDSAVFIEAESFNIGSIDLGDNFIVGNARALCPDKSVVLNSGINELEDSTCDVEYIYQWFYNDEAIPGATESTYEATEAGNYTLHATIQITSGNQTTDCDLQPDSVIIEFLPEFDIEELDEIVVCGNPAMPQSFNLTLAEQQIAQSNILVTDITYYFTEQEANDIGALRIDWHEIPGQPGNYYNLTDFESSGLNSVWVRITQGSGYHNDSCFIVLELVLRVTNCDIDTPDNIVVCDTNNDFTEAIDLAPIHQQLNADFPLVTTSFHTTFLGAQTSATTDVIDPTQPFNAPLGVTTIFIRAQGVDNPAHFTTTAFVIDVLQLPQINENVTNYELCANPDGTAEFDLTSKSGEILGVHIADLKFYTSQEDIDEDNFIVNPESFLSSGQPIWVVVTGTNQCSITTTFNLIIKENLPSNENIEDYTLCSDEDGVAIFDLTSKNEVILAGLTAEVTFYNSQADAQTGSNPIAATTAYESAGETIWVRVENEDGCFGVTSFDLVVVASPIINTNVTNYVLCDFNADGQASFELTSKAEEILNGAGATLTYYTSEANANQATQAIANTTAFSAADGSVIWVRAEIEGGCYSITSFTLEVTTNEVIADAAPIELCRNNNQGNVIFDLTQAGTALVTDASDVVTYHTTLQAAQQGVAAINNTTVYAISSTQTVYIRIESETACPKISSVQLVVMPAPALATTITNYVLCEEADQMASFDLTSKTNEILAGSTATISFYASAADLENNNPIADPTAYLSGSATIWVKAENAEGCFSTRTFNLVVNNLPVTYAPDPIYVCNDGTGFGSFNLNIRNQQIAGSIPGLQVTYHLTLADAQNNINHLSSPYNGTHEQVLYVRVANGFGCVDTTQTLTLYLEDSTINPALDPLYMCDPNSDGWGVFDLTQVEATIIAANPNPVTITYHETYLDAQFAANVIPNPTTYFNIAHQSQTIYVLITPASGNACATIGTVELIVNNLPLINKNLDPIALCDDNTDGLATFDLTQAVAQVLGNLDPALHTVEFYSSEADARGANNPIANPTNYVNTLAGQDQVWIRVSHIDSGCFDVVALDLIVHPLPNVAQPNVPAYHLCDSDEDGFEVFDLESYIDIITQGQSGLAVSYHITYEEALSGTNAITNLQFTNQAQYVQTIFVRVETENGCSVVTLLDLVTDPLPVLATPEPIVVCDPDADGFGNVDLSLALDQLLNGANPADYQITFHETYTDAQYGQAAIDPITSYFNIDPFTQVIYVRVATTAESGCTNIYPLTIVVEPAPILPTDPDNTLPALEICDTNTDGFAYFDLTQQTTYILDNTVSNTANLVVTYHLTQADAEQGVMAITNVTNYLNLSNPQTLWVRLASSVTECFDVASFELIVNVPLTLPTSIQPITICDTDRDGINVYDLTVRIPAILANATNPANYTVDFFPSYAEALAGENQIENPEAYTSNLHVRSIGVRVTDNTTGCVSYWFFDIRRAPMPNVPPTPTQPLTVCDVTPGANGQDDFIESFDLTVYEEFLRQGDTYLILTYHTSEQDAIDGVNAIADPTDFVSGDTTIYVRVANQPNMGVSCFEIVSFDIVVEPLPLVADNSFEVCEVGSTGFAEFNFLEFNPQLLGPTQELSDFTISYHPTQADAEANTNAISQTTPYQNTSQYAESIWVRIVNIETTCTRVAEITLFAEEGATATQPAQGMFVCDEFDGANDGFTSFDLTAVEAEVLNGQDPAQFAVSYHTTEADANVNANPITTPEDFINTIQGGQTIYIRVENTATNAPCYAVTTLEIVAEQLAEPVITASAPTLCVDWGNTLANDPVILDSGITATGYTFEWYHNGTLVEDENQATLTLTEIGQEGTYEVIAISQNGCISEISESFQVLLSGKASLVSVMTSNAFQGNQNIIVTVEGNGVYAFQLDNGPIQDNGFFADVAPGTHTVTVYDIVTGDINQTYSCATLVISDIQLVDYMKFFTPNGDGYNDYWKITGLNEDHNAEIYIFDRYGKLLKQLNPLGEGWDGTFNGKPLPSTDYWFKVIYNEKDLENNIARKEFRAHFSLKR